MSNHALTESTLGYIRFKTHYHRCDLFFFYRFDYTLDSTMWYRREGTGKGCN